MHDALRPLFEDAVIKARDIPRVLGLLSIAAGVVLLVLLVAIPSKPGEEAAKGVMAVLDLVAFGVGARQLGVAKRYEAELRALFAEPARAKSIVFVRVRKGPSITYAFHFDVGAKEPLVLPVLNAPAFEAMRPLVVAHFPSARVG